jgi:hypothetical protein
MTDWYSDVTGAKPAAAPPRQADPNWYMDMINAGQPELRQGPMERMRAAPLGDTLERGASPLQAGIASLAPDPEGQIALLAKQMNIPKERFGVLDGNIVYADERGQIQRAIPSVMKGGVLETLQRFAPWAASQFGPMLPQAAGTVAGIATAPLGPATSIASSTGAGFVTDAGRQYVANKLIGDDERGIDWLNAGGQGALAGGSQALSLSLAKLYNQNPMGVGPADRASAIDPQRQAQAQALEAEAKRRGIDLSAGQATGLPSLRVQERQLGRYPETMDRVTDFVTKQRQEQIPAAVSREIAAISPARGEQAINQFREGATAVADQAFAQRSAQAAQAYGKALQAAPFTDDALKPILQRPSIQAAWDDAVKLAAERNVQLPAKLPDGPLDWQSWDWLKQGLDAQIEKGTNELGRLTKFGYGVKETQRDLLKVLDAANPDYAAARAVYGKASDAVDAVLEGGAGLIKNLDGEARRNMLTKVFSGSEAGLLPEQVARMRNQFMAAGKLEDWNAGAAAWLADALDKSTAVGVANTPQNLVKQVWGTENKREVMRAALGNNSERLASFEKLMEVLQAASKSLPEGSPTATDLAAMSGPQTVGKGLQVVGKALSPGSYLNLGNDVVAGIDAMRTPAARVKLAEALLSGDYAKELSQLRMLPPTGEKALQVTTQILTRAGVVGAGSATGLGVPADQPIRDFGDAR